MTAVPVILEGKAEFTAAEFADFWAGWHSKLHGLPEDSPSSVETGYNSEVEVAPGVVFKRAGLLPPDPRCEESGEPPAMSFLSGYCSATVPLDQLLHASVYLHWMEFGGPGMSTMDWDVVLTKTDGYVIKAHLVEVIRCNRRVRERLRSWLQERLAVQAGLEVR